MDDYLDREKEAVNGLYDGLLKSKLVTEGGKVHSSDMVWDVIVYSYCKRLQKFIPEMKPEFGMWLERVFAMPKDPPYIEKELNQLALASAESMRKELEIYYKHHSSPTFCSELPAIMVKFLNFRLRWMQGRSAYIKRITCPDCKHQHDGTYRGRCNCWCRID